MIKTAEIKLNVNYLAKTGVLLALALTFQIGFSSFAQPAVGPLVNMTLFIAAIYVGTLSAALIGTLTPLSAFLLGIMPLFPIVSFIMIANLTLVILFTFVRRVNGKYGDVLGVIAGAVGKFLFLSISVRYVASYFLPQVPPKIVEMMTFPQLYTALVGGLIALLVSKKLIKYNK